MNEKQCKNVSLQICAIYIVRSNRGDDASRFWSQVLGIKFSELQEKISTLRKVLMPGYKPKPSDETLIKAHKALKKLDIPSVKNVMKESTWRGQ